MSENKKYSGFLVTELVVSLSVLVILLACLALSLDGFRKFNHYQLVRQRCVAAAQAELDSIAVTGKEISQEDFGRLWPKLSVAIERSNGTGQWKGMKLTKVTTSGNSFRNEVKVQLCRYVPAEEEK